MTDMIKIDSHKAIELLREVIKGDEDYVYEPRAVGSGDPRPACVYEADDKPSCVVGRALHKAGVTTEQLREMDVAVNAAIGCVPMPENVFLTYGARSVFTAAQIAQDNHMTWGSALDKAETRYTTMAGNSFNDAG